MNACVLFFHTWLSYIYTTILLIICVYILNLPEVEEIIAAFEGKELYKNVHIMKTQQYT